jgi:hypothetical protein
MTLALHSWNESSVIENWHFPRPCAAIVKYPDLVMKIGCEYRFCLLADLRVFPWLFEFLFACFGFFWNEGSV